MPLTRPKAAQINFDVTNITDPLFRLNSGQSGSNDKDAGIVMERGSDTNVALIWDESANEFALITTNETGSTAGDVAVIEGAGLRVGYLHLADSSELKLGDDNDANIKHTGTNLNINETTGDINIRLFGIIIFLFLRTLFVLGCIGKTILKVIFSKFLNISLIFFSFVLYALCIVNKT